MTLGQGERLSLASQQRPCLLSAAAAADIGGGRCIPVLLLVLLASENVVVAAHKLAYQPEIVDSSNTVGYQVVCLHSDARAHHLAVKHGVLVVLH